MNLSAKSSELKSKITHWLALVSFLLLFPSLAMAAATCPTGYVPSTVAAGEYNQWPEKSFNSVITAAGSSPGTDDDVIITGSMTTKGFSQSINGAVNTKSPTGGAFFIKQDMRSNNDSNTITYKFNRPLLNLSMSVYDIDRQYRAWSYPIDYNWKDKVRFIAKNTNAENVLPVFSNIGQYISTSGDTALGDAGFLVTCNDNFSNDCKVTASFDKPISELSIEYGNASDAIADPVEQNIEVVFDDFCVKLPDFTISKDDGLTSIGTSNTTDYIITVTNTGDTPLENIVLKDPVAAGLSKQSNITCDSTDTNNVCNNNTVPTITSLESITGFNISSIPVGKSYSIIVPTLVTATSGSTVQNNATATRKSSSTTKTATDINTVTSTFDGGSTSTPATCPANHLMYYFNGKNTPSHTPIKRQAMSWSTSSKTKTFTVDNIKFNLTFSDTLYLRTKYPSYNLASDQSVTTNAINMYHDSPLSAINHRLTATIDKPISRFGFVVQDLDTSEDRYVESISFDTKNGNAVGGLFSFPSSFNDFLELSNNNKTISGKKWTNCSTGTPCDFNVDWGYQPINTPFVVTHGNTFNTTSTTGQLMGYSDFYFCLAPPKLVIKKSLKGSRVNDIDAKRDQFEISATSNSLATNSFTTTGKGANILKGSSAVLELAENKSYTITERVMNVKAIGDVKTLGDIANYDATYTCTNATTGSTIVTTPMTYDASNKTRSFGLSDLKYGDEITCTITNTPKSYTFSGTVFNDNGGITSPNPELVGGIYNNANFFNGIFDTNESGIDGMDVVKARLSDCSNPSANPIIATVNVTSLGKYSFAVSARDLAGKTNLCIEELEPNNWLYSVDTTPNIQKFNFNPSVLTYQTGVEINGNTLNLDFGNVIKENTALVLVKSQYVHDCSLTDLTTIEINYSGLATAAYSTQPISDIEPGQCIAYRIEAINRGNVPLTDIIIKDTLQEKGKNGALVTSTLANPQPIGENAGVPTFPTDSVVIGSNGIVITNNFTLDSKGSNNRKAIRFNTKYGLITGN